MEAEVASKHASLEKEIEQQADKLARAAEQARADLDLEIKARRAEAERELLDAHQEAVRANSLYIDEAHKDLEELKSRVEALRVEHDELVTAVATAKAETTQAAHEEAKQTVAAAEARAAEMVREAEQTARATLAESEKRVAELRAERDTIAGYIESLRTVVAGIEHTHVQHSDEEQTA